MIVLKADKELKLTFEKLISMLEVPVEWSGLFFCVGDYLILQGSVRSLFFNFETKKVLTNLIELEAKQDDIVQIEDYPRTKDVLNMVLYTFGKWGSVKGLKVEKDYKQLNSLFSRILGEFQVEPQYGPKNFHFFQNKIRLTYEDVIELSLKEEQEELMPEQEETRGLWHKLIWKKMKGSFSLVETTVEERRKNRIGNNFYIVGYLCPKCQKKLHMAIYPEQKEFRIETQEGDVLMTRVYTCSDCCRMYTPRPQQLLVDGDVYCMDFEKDITAYEDYLELLGRTAGRNVNTKYNEFADKSRQTPPPSEEEQVEKILEQLPLLSDEELYRIMQKMEERYFSEENIQRLERAIAQREEKKKQRNSEPLEAEKNTTYISNKQEQEPHNEEKQEKKRKLGIFKLSKSEPETEKIQRTDDIVKEKKETQPKAAHEEKRAKETAVFQKKDIISKESTIQTTEVLAETGTPEQKKTSERRYHANPDRHTAVKISKEQWRAAGRKKKEDSDYITARGAADSRMEKEQLKKAAHRSKEYDDFEWKKENEKEEPMRRVKESAFSQKKRNFAQQRMPRDYGTGVKELVSEQKTPEQLKNDLKKQQEDLAKLTRIQVRLNRQGKTKEELKSLTEEMQKQDIEPQLLEPYLKQAEQEIRQIDQRELDAICQNTDELDFEDAKRAYEEIQDGDFLPELKYDALRELEKRMQKIKSDECELLVKKLMTAMEENQVGQIPQFHFYPAKRVLQKQALPEETRMIDTAVSAYASGIAKFEYPVLVVDKSKDLSGKEGFLLTPEHIFYSAWLTSYYIPIMEIERFEAQNGLFGKAVFVFQKNGTKTKLPIPPELKEVEKMAQILQEFVWYLQEKPFSRKEAYLTEEKHETICCYRCGYIYKGGGTCPRCGYKQNE